MKILVVLDLFHPFLLGGEETQDVWKGMRAGEKQDQPMEKPAPHATSS